jgi:hypothetical protein
MRQGLAVDTGERPRLSAPGSARRERSDGRDETRSLRATSAKTAQTQPQPSPSTIGSIGEGRGDTSEGCRRRPGRRGIAASGGGRGPWTLIQCSGLSPRWVGSIPIRLRYQ